MDTIHVRVGLRTSSRGADGREDRSFREILLLQMLAAMGSRSISLPPTMSKEVLFRRAV